MNEITAAKSIPATIIIVKSTVRVITTCEGRTKVIFTATRNGVFKMSVDSDLEVCFEVKLEGDHAQNNKVHFRNYSYLD